MGQVFHSGTFTVPGSGLTDPNTGQMIAVGSPSQIQNDVYQRGAQNNATQHPVLAGVDQQDQRLRNRVAKQRKQIARAA